jgi:hypothetical protein
MRPGSLFYLLVGLPALGGMLPTGFPAQALELAQAETGSAGMTPGGTHPSAADWHWRLTGTVVGPKQREAVFAQGSETREVEEGREIDGWKLSAVDVSGAMLTRAGRTRTVTVDGLDDIESGRAALPSAAVTRAANDAAMSALAKQSAEEKAAEKILHQATKAMFDQATGPGQSHE